MSSLFALKSSSFAFALASADLDDPSVLRLAAAGFDAQQAKLQELLELLVKNSNSNVASYQILVEVHGYCEQQIKNSAGQGHANAVTTFIQHVQAQKAQIERAMLEVENVQSFYWTEIQRLQTISKWTA